VKSKPFNNPEKSPVNGQPKESPLVQAAYGFCKDLQILTAKFPRKDKFILGEKLALSAIDLLALLAGASSELDVTVKVSKLKAVSSKFLPMRLLLRLARDLNCVSAGQYIDQSMALDEIQRQAKLLQQWAEGSLMGTSGGESRCFNTKQDGAAARI
jgi:hypothetical protein